MKKNVNGITLIALVITIVIIIILAAVSINIVFGEDGIIGTSKTAVDEWQEGEEREKQELNTIGNYLNSQTEITTLAGLYDAGELEIGDYVGYTPDSAAQYTSLEAQNGTEDQNFSQEELEWRVLGKDSTTGGILLIGAEPTTAQIGFTGPKGYLYAENELNTLCANLYSKSGVGNARSINREDIQNASNYNPESYGFWKSSGMSSIIREYGQTINLTNIYYPDNSEILGYKMGDNSFITTYYGYNNIARNVGESGYMKTVRLAELLLGANAEFKYWQANTCIETIKWGAPQTYNTMAQFGICTIGENYDSYAGEDAYTYSGSISACFVYDTTNTTNSRYRSIRPVVLLNPNVMLAYSKAGEANYINSINW